ncbi:VOC family protein [Paracoccus sp. Z118]|uniref:VOC family protein n=1 Tax=Paracoccus sp. Z118 TaxID=2851017 RepID=UPI001C2C35A4|nr:VOC family protein [Paracoccus sp. Z118]MBV0891874.1 VOC family protein [Paracoccus sp. Z118]
MSYHGRPCWFELGTSDPDAAAAFYEALLGWAVGENVMPPPGEYRLAQIGGDMVAGLMPLSLQPEGTPPNWTPYICVDDADAAARLASDRGGRVLQQPHDIPGTGRFAILADPQGAVFAILQPAPMEVEPGPDQGAWAPMKPGRGCWLELMTTDMEAGFAFYAALFGWTGGERMSMGEAGDYQLFERKGEALGGMMGLGDAPAPVWLSYFGVEGPMTQVVERIAALEGRVHMGPVEVPGPAYVCVAQDPQGAWFALASETR